MLLAGRLGDQTLGLGNGKALTGIDSSLKPDSSPARAQALLAADPRIKIGLTFLLGLLTWRAGPAGVALYGLSLGVLLYFLGDIRAANQKVVRTFAFFVFIWMGIKLIFDLIGGAGLVPASLRAGELGLRLLVLLLLGLALALSTSPRGLGLALSWFLRPVLGKKAWQAALALALMVHFLPLTWQTFDTVRTTISLRAPRLSWPRRVLLLAQAAMRALSQKTWNQTVAIAARGLDSPGAWTARFEIRPQEWAVGLSAAALGIAAAWI